MREKIAAFIICLLAIAFTDQFHLPVLANTELWFYLVLISGFLGFLFLFSRAHTIVKVFIIYSFINCFLSRAPYLSFTAFAVLMVAAGFYLLCLEIRNYDFIYKAIQSVFFLNVAIIVIQKLGFDKLLNFGHSIAQATYWGTIGNPMVLGSFIICLVPFLAAYKKQNIFPIGLAVYISRSYGAVLSVLAGLFVYLRGWKKLIIVAIVVCSLFMAKDKIRAHYTGGRWPVWKRTISLTAREHPFFGYGLGTYKVIFPVLSRDVAGGVTNKWLYQGTEGDWVAWRQAHNCWLQILWELGFIGAGLLAGFIGLLLYRIRKDRILFSSAVLLLINMSWSFPTRMIQTVPLLILFLTVCEKR
ncbi:MAG: O-antigen ligase family protein [Candidatus Omnitrophota bacterium]|jgi:O-antigen ligase